MFASKSDGMVENIKSSSDSVSASVLGLVFVVEVVELELVVLCGVTLTMSFNLLRI